MTKNKNLYDKKVYLIIKRKTGKITYGLAININDRLEMKTSDLSATELQKLVTVNNYFLKYQIKQEEIKNEISKYTYILNEYPKGEVTIEIPIK